MLVCAFIFEMEGLDEGSWIKVLNLRLGDSTIHACSQCGLLGQGSTYLFLLLFFSLSLSPSPSLSLSLSLCLSLYLSLSLSLPLCSIAAFMHPLSGYTYAYTRTTLFRGQHVSVLAALTQHCANTSLTRLGVDALLPPSNKQQHYECRAFHMSRAHA